MSSELSLKNIQPLFVDTEFHFPETHALLEEYEKLLGISIKRKGPKDNDIKELLSQHRTVAPFYSQKGADACCHARKVQPLLTELASGYTGRIAGLMQSEGGKRDNTQIISKDKRFTPSLPIYHPLFDWKANDLESYIQKHSLPIHALYEKGYASIGCFPCTTALLPGETDPRSGRWRHLDTGDAPSKTYCAMNPTDTFRDGSGI